MYEKIASVVETAFTDTGLTASTTYRYWVRASDSNGALSSGLQVSVKTLSPGMTQPPDGGMGSNQPPDAGFRPTGPFTAIISNLPDESFTNAATVTVKFDVTGSPDSVTLLKDDAVLAVLKAPNFEFAWNTAAEAEKTYSLKALATKAGVDSQMSGVKTLTVDGTAPKVVTQVPLNNATNVYLADEMSVTFSEGVAAATVNDSTVQLKAASAAVQSEKVLSGDGVKLVVKPRVLPTLPAAMELALEQVTDKAGNVVVAPAMKFEAPAWQQMGGALNAEKYVGISESSLAVTKSGEVYAAFFQGVRGSGNFNLVGTGTVSKWTGAAWNRVGQDLPATTSYIPDVLDLALTPEQNPVVAWGVDNGQNEEILVRRHGLQGWDSFPALKRNEKPETLSVHLAIDSLNRIVVGWDERVKGTYVSYGALSRSNGNSWTSVIEPRSPGGEPCAVNAVAMDSADHPTIVCISREPKISQAYVKKFENGVWTQIGAGSASAFPDRYTSGPKILLNNSNVPRVSFLESFSQFEGPRFTSVLLRGFNGAWRNLGVVASDSDPAIQSYSISKDVGDGLTAAILERVGNGNNARIVVKHQAAGGQFQQSGPPILVSGFLDSPSISVRVDPSTNPIVMYVDRISGVDFLFAKRLNRLP